MFDQPRNRLFDFLSSPFRAAGDCRRTTVRHRSMADARLSWVARGQIHTVEARILDISREGAGLLAEQTPPWGARVRLHLVDRESNTWVDGEVLGVEPKATGGRRIRLLFSDACPTVFLRSAVRSLPAPAPAAVDVEVAAEAY
jgi:hypothetical protein